MESLTEYILTTFQTLWPRLQQNPQDLAARLQRRRQTFLQRPPRPWCIALRANDRRMTPRNTAIDDPYAVADRLSHRIHLTAPLVRRLVAPITLHWMGRTSNEVAELLGVEPGHLRRARATGVFFERGIKGLAGAPGKPVPILYRRTPLDPTGRLFLPPPGYWGHAWQHRGDHLPDDFSQWIQRRPALYPRTGKFHRWVWSCPACGRGCLELFYPLQVPHVETYLRIHVANTVADAQHRPPARFTAAADAPATALEDDTPLAHIGHDTDSPAAPLAPLPTFACNSCHRVNSIAQTENDGWNQFVSYLTCGLLYGRDVPRPADWFQRKVAYAPRPRKQPPPRRTEVLNLLVNTDWSPRRIGQELQMNRGTVIVHRTRLYKQFGVHCRADLQRHPDAPRTPKAFGRTG